MFSRRPRGGSNNAGDKEKSSRRWADGDEDEDELPPPPSAAESGGGGRWGSNAAERNFGGAKPRGEAEAEARGAASSETSLSLGLVVELVATSANVQPRDVQVRRTARCIAHRTARHTARRSTRRSAPSSALCALAGGAASGCRAARRRGHLARRRLHDARRLRQRRRSARSARRAAASWNRARGGDCRLQRRRARGGRGAPAAAAAAAAENSGLAGLKSRELVALWPPSHSPVFWRPQGSRPLLRRDRSCAPHKLACASACTRGGAVCVFGSGHRARVSADTHRTRASCYQQAGGAATRLIMSSLAGPGGLSEQEAAAVRRPHPCPRPRPCPSAVRMRCTGTQGGLAENLPAARGEAGRAARPARERAHRRGAAAGARGRVERPGLNGQD